MSHPVSFCRFSNVDQLTAAPPPSVSALDTRFLGEVSMTRLGTSLVVGAVGVLASSCDQTPVTEMDAGAVVTAMNVVSGGNQTGPSGEELPEPLVVQALDAHGHGVGNQLVNFRVLEGGGSMWAGSAMSDRDGLAQNWWTLGPPGHQTVEARAVDIYLTVNGLIDGTGNTYEGGVGGAGGMGGHIGASSGGQGAGGGVYTVYPC